MSLYRRAVRPLLFRLDPERAHNGAIALGAGLGRTGFGAAAVGRLFRFEDDRLRQQVAGMTFANPVGLAAGFDKSGRAVRGLASFGFGSLEVGSVSAHPSRGNRERPRLFRLPADEAIVVYYGVPNDGAEVVARRLERSRVDVPLGVNLVETNTGVPVPAGEVTAELSEAAQAFAGIADYLALNLNCPNTGGGRSPFDDAAMIRELLGILAGIPGLPPVFLKLTASADPGRRDGVLEAIDGFPFVKGIVFNLPPGIPPQGLKTPASELARMPGTLCGPPRKGARQPGDPRLVPPPRPLPSRHRRQRRNLLRGGRVREDPPRGDAAAALHRSRLQGAGDRPRDQPRPVPAPRAGRLLPPEGSSRSGLRFRGPPGGRGRSRTGRHRFANHAGREPGIERVTGGGRDSGHAAGRRGCCGRRGRRFSLRRRLRQRAGDRAGDGLMAAAPDILTGIGRRSGALLAGAAIAVRGRSANSGTSFFFEEHVLAGRPHVPAARRLPTTRAIVQAVAGNPAAIGYGGMAYGPDSFTARSTGWPRPRRTCAAGSTRSPATCGSTRCGLRRGA